MEQSLKRKVVRHGPSSLTISLPMTWAKKFNVKAGDEVEVEEKGESVLVTSGKNVKCVMKKEINISEYGSMMGRALGALYKIGYDEVVINYDDVNTYETVQNEFKKGLIGWEIIAHGKNHCVVKLVARDLSEEFNTMFRREFLVLLSICDDSFDVVKNNNFDDLRSIILRDMSVNKFSDFCRRVLNKGSISDCRSNPMYYIIEELEKLGDDFRDMNQLIMEKRIKLGKESLALYKRVTDYLRQYYEAFFDFSPKKMDAFKTVGDKLLKDLDKAYEQHGNKNELRIICYFHSITTKIFDFNGALLTIKL